MKEHLLGYLLNVLDDEAQQEVEAQLEGDPEAQAQLEKLREALEPLAADREDPEPPPALVFRTIGRVAEYECAPRSLPQAPLPTPASFASGRPSWRLIDFAVAASLFLVAAGLTTLAVLHVRQSWTITACQNNLRDFYAALDQYHTQHPQKHFPNVQEHEGKNRNVAGMVIPMLISAGFLPANTNVRCPGNGEATPCPLTLEKILALPDAEFPTWAPEISRCYAYCLGYRDENGVYHCPQRDPDKTQVPLMADCPPLNDSSGNSHNHGERGQNVLFQDGRVVFLKSRHINNDDFYVNKNGKISAGKGPDDVVLGASASKP